MVFNKVFRKHFLGSNFELNKQGEIRRQMLSNRIKNHFVETNSVREGIIWLS